jgi:hypothetical protein
MFSLAGGESLGLGFGFISRDESDTLTTKGAIALLGTWLGGDSAIIGGGDSNCFGELPPSSMGGFIEFIEF